jgi:MFS family permease
MGRTSPYRLTLWVCLAEISALASIAVFPALLPTFQAEWGLNNTEAGWISAAYYGGYMVLVPVLASVTDRLDARRIMGLGALLGIMSALGYAFGARGFWSALIFRLVAGISLAGIYMPGLKVVSDNTEGVLQSRFVSFYTASFSIGASLSYLLAGEVNSLAGWRWAFAASAACSAVALAIIMMAIPPAMVRREKIDSVWTDFKIVFKSRAAMAYVLGYAAHMWELFSMRSWIVAFLAFSIQLQPADAMTWSPTRVAFIINLIGLPASIAGNEMSRIFDRPKVVMAVMIASAALASALGCSAGLPYVLVASMAILHGITVVGDSAALTAGVVAAAPEGFRGTTLAVHSTLGFGAAFLGPLTVGMVLDFFGGHQTGWAMAFITMAAGCLLGPVFLAILKPGAVTDKEG